MMIYRRFCAAAAVLWICFIFSNSLQPAAASAQASGRILELLSTLMAGFPLTLTDHIVRKSAHFFEFSVLGFLLRGGIGRRMPLPVVGALIPCMDEGLQLLSDGRSARLSDVLLDCSGVLFGVLCFALLRALMRRLWKGLSDRA